MLLFHSHPRPLYSSRPGLLSRPIPRNPDCTQPSVSRFVGSILQRPPSPPHPLSSLESVFFLVWPPIFHVSLRLRVAPLFSIGTFSRGGSGEGDSERTIRADATYARHLKKSPRHWPRLRFHSTLCRRRVERPRQTVPRLAKCRLERRRLVEVAITTARSARSQRLYEASGR